MYLSVLHFLQFHFTILVVINLSFWVYYGIIGIPPYTITLHPLVCSPHSRKLTYTLLTSTNHKKPNSTLISGYQTQQKYTKNWPEQISGLLCQVQTTGNSCL